MKIMVCYDGSKPSIEALKEAKGQAEIHKAQTLIVWSMVTQDRFHEKEITAAKDNLEQIQDEFEKEGLSCSTHLSIRGMEPAEDMLLFAQENNIDQIVIGIRKRSKVGKLLMGSVAQLVILNASCPVLCVK
jgi:nucleotide-binding universal stress UspA family protein